MTTGMTVPVSLCVWALKALQNSMMLIPCWPRAGPTGGAGLAWPPSACSLIVVRTFFATLAPRRRLQLFDLVEADLDRGLAPEDRYQHLQLGGVVVYLGDLAGEVRERARDDLHRLADRKLGARTGGGGDLLVEQPIDLPLRERDGLLGCTDEARHPRGALHDAPGVLVELHVDEHVAGHRALLHGHLLVVLHLRDRFGGHDDLAHGALLPERHDAVLE